MASEKKLHWTQTPEGQRKMQAASKKAWRTRRLHARQRDAARNDFVTFKQAEHRRYAKVRTEQTNGHGAKTKATMPLLVQLDALIADATKTRDLAKTLLRTVALALTQ